MNIGMMRFLLPKSMEWLLVVVLLVKKVLQKYNSLITSTGTDATAREFALMGMTSEVQAYKNSLKTLEKQKRVYQQNQLGYEEKIRVLTIAFRNTTNLLKHSERINVEAEIAKKDLQTKLDNHLAKTEKWTSSSKNLFRLIDSSMSVLKCWKVRPLFHKFNQKADGMKQFLTSFRDTQSNQFVQQALLLMVWRGFKIPLARPKPGYIFLLDVQKLVSTGRTKNHFYCAQYLLVTLHTDAGDGRDSRIVVVLVPAGRPKLVSTGRPKPASTDKQNRPPLVHAGRRNFSSVTSGWWQSTARPMTHFPTPTSSYFQTSTPFGPHVYYNQMHYDGDGWATAVKPSAETKDETYPILKDFISLVENQLNKKQNGVAERKNRTLIEAARTMLADSKLPTMFWTEAVSTACYVLNRVLITNPHNKTPYALLTGKTPSISHFKPFGCHVTILNTSDHLSKLDGKADEGYLVGYSSSNRAYRVYNMANKRVEETMNLRFLEEKANIQGIGHEWSFDLDYLTDSLGYNRDKANRSAGTHGVSSNPAGFQDDDSDSDSDEQVILVPSYPSNNIPGAEPKDTSDAHSNGVLVDTAEDIFQQELARLKDQEQRATSDAERLGLGFAKDAEELQKRASAKTVPPGSIPVPTGSIPVPSSDTMVSPSDVSVPTGCISVPSGSPTDLFFDVEPTTRFSSPSDLGNYVPSPGIFSSTSYDNEFGADLNNLASTMEVSLVATKRINIVHPQSLIIGEPNSSVQTRSQAEMQQFKFQNVWILVDLPAVARIEAIILFLAFASYMGFMVYQMDVKSAFLYESIDEEVYVTQPKGFVDPQYPKKVYKVVKALYGLHRAPRAWYATLSTFLLKHGYRKGTIDKTLFHKKHKRDIILVQVYVDDIIFGSTKKAWCDEFEALIKGEFEISAMGELIFFLGLQVQQRPDGIFIGQDKYVQEILKKFDLESVRTATTPYEAPKPKSKNEPDNPVNVHLCRSMIGSLMYLTASMPDIMFAVSACSRNQVTPTTSNLEAVKKIFKYLKGQPKLGLWYPRELPFVLEAYSNSDYAGSNKDRKSTTGRCQFLGRRLISWQCRKQTIMATSSTEAEYVAAANCCGQTKHIEIRHHIIRYANEKKLIQVLKIHTDDNVADLLTKAFDGPRFHHLVVNIGMLNP
ncbi:putative ribonuclease H-like domain-containing protein [Tanacetum coccineum]